MTPFLPCLFPSSYSLALSCDFLSDLYEYSGRLCLFPCSARWAWLGCSANGASNFPLSQACICIFQGCDIGTTKAENTVLERLLMSKLWRERYEFTKGHNEHDMDACLIRLDVRDIHYYVQLKP